MVPRDDAAMAVEKVQDRSRAEESAIAELRCSNEEFRSEAKVAALEALGGTGG